MSQIGNLIRRAARHHGDRPCLIEGARTVSFRDFDRLTDRMGNAVLDGGLVPGDRVGVLLPNGIDCLVTYYALAKAGLVRVSLNTRETAHDHRYKLADSQSRAVVHDGSHGDLGVERVIDARTLGGATGDFRPCVVERDLDAAYRLGYTGGTTGEAKAVTLTERGELAELSAFLVDLVPGLCAADRFLHAAPIAHASGAFFLPALARGATSLVMAKFDAAAFIALAAETQATATFLVPTMLALILDEPGLAAADLHLGRIVYGASPIAPSVLARAEKRFGRVLCPKLWSGRKPDGHHLPRSRGSRPGRVVRAAVHRCRRRRS